MTGGTLPERVAQLYYTYGLFCSSYPTLAISLALSVVLLCCYPLLNVPLPGNIPIVANLPLQKESGLSCVTENCPHADTKFQLELLNNETQKLTYVWAKDKPLLYVQQIILKIGVSPWSSNLKMYDAFRAPLQEVFRLLETIRNHEDPSTKVTLSQQCYQIEAIRRGDDKPSLERVLPEYSCLLLSPANLWQQNLQSFSLDSNIVNTIYNYQKGKTSIAEMAFGMQLRDSGVKRYPLRVRPRVLQYAVTIFYQEADQGFIESLSTKLRDMYPLYQEKPYTHAYEATLIYYPGKFNYHEVLHLFIAFLGIFIYVYFSVRKIEFIRSKFGLAACAVLTIAGSLSMSMGICFYFGFSFSHQGKGILPSLYLVILVGLENVLVLTKSVTSTDSRLDVKIRLAQGLSKEGWSITQNILFEITVFTVSFFTFVPFIQEFSIFMILSLISDYFMQMLFFATILGIDVRRMEYFQEQNRLHLKDYFNTNNALNWRYNSYVEENFYSPQRMIKSKSHPRLNGLAQGSPTDVVARRKSSPISQENKVPKRIRLVNIWARTRFFQRAFMIWMLVWISMIIYNSGIVDYFITNADKNERKENRTKVLNDKPKEPTLVFYNNSDKSSMIFSPLLEVSDTEIKDVDAHANDTVMLKHSAHLRPWSRLSPYHWSSILSQYNESTAGRHIVVLPPLLLSHRVGPERAIAVRHPDDRDPPPLRWQALAVALDPIDILPDFDLIEGKSQAHQYGKSTDLPIYPTTPMEILLLAILCLISVAVIAYMMVVLYRCICSRNYAEWRASWSEDEQYKKIIAKQPAVQLVMEAVPIVVSGHSQEVECVVSDGELIISSCLQGQVKVWDSQNGELLTNIDRNAFFKLQKDLSEKVHFKKNNNSYEVVEVSTQQRKTSPRPLQITSSPQLRKGLSNHLSGLRFRSTAKGEREDTHQQNHIADCTKYDFAKSYRELYCTNQQDGLYNSFEVKENSDTILNAPQEQNHVNKKQNKLSESNSFSVNESEQNSEHKCKSDKSNRTNSEIVTNLNWKGNAVKESPIWCMDFCNDLIILGCADGRLEFWEASSGKLMCIWWSADRSNGRTSGVTHVRALSGARKVCYATLAGYLSLLRLEAFNISSGTHVDWNFSTAHRRTHKRTGSAGSLRGVQSSRLPYQSESGDSEEVSCVRVAHCRPHQQPITELQSEGGRILTGGQDHVLKVFSSSELTALFTLHGHCGPITSCFIDHVTPTIAGSGSQDGLLCVWDLHTGACLYSIQAHDGAVTSLAYTASYVISSGTDERLCIWDRFQGHMLNSVHIGLNYMSKMLPLTHSLLLIGDRGGLAAYDLSSGDVIRRVLLGENDACVFVRQILPLKDAIVCDYSNQLRIVRFPYVSRMNDMKNE